MTTYLNPQTKHDNISMAPRVIDCSFIGGGNFGKRIYWQVGGGNFGGGQN